MNNKTFRRPMFRKGGSAEGGITSGLGRPGYAENGSVEELTTKEELLQSMGAQTPGRNFNDFLINFGLNMVGNAPTGNIFQTAATQAKEPYSQFAKANQAEQNLLRQVGLEAGTMDIAARNAADAARLIEEGKDRRQTKTLKSQADMFKEEKTLLKEAEKRNFINRYMEANSLANSKEAANVYMWRNEVFDRPDYKNIEDGGFIAKGVLNNPRRRSDHAKKQEKKNAIFFDKENGIILKVGLNENGDITYIPVESFTETSKIVSEKKPTYSGEFSENPSYKRKPKEFKIPETDTFDPLQP